MNGVVLMDLDYEKERLLGLIEVYNLYDEDEITTKIILGQKFMFTLKTTSTNFGNP